MYAGATLIAHAQTAEGVQPGDGALHHPAISTESLAGLDAAPGDAQSEPRARRARRQAPAALNGSLPIRSGDRRS